MLTGQARRGLGSLFALGIVCATLGCGSDSDDKTAADTPTEHPGGQDAKPLANLHELRNVGLLQAARDTNDGYAEAAVAFETCATSSQAAADYLNLARVLVLSSRWEEGEKALSSLRGVLGDSEVPLDVLYLEGLVLKFTKRFDEAIERLARVTQGAPAIQAPWYQLANSHYEKKDFQKAIPVYEKLFALNEYHQGAVYNLMQAYGRLKDAEGQAKWTKEFKALKALKLPEPGVRDYMVCRFTRVDLVPPSRDGVEPPRRSVSFAAWSPEGVPADLTDVRAVVPLDFDADLDVDLYVVRKGANVLLRNDGGKFEDVSEFSDATDEKDARGVVAADFDNDGIVDFFLAYTEKGGAFYRGIGEGIFQLEEESGLDSAQVRAARAIDYDHDGDLDLVTLEAESADARTARGRIWRNAGDRTFEEIADLLPGTVASVASSKLVDFAVGDFDRGNDVDFVFASKGSVALFLNQRQGAFRRLDLPAEPSATSIVALDRDNDGDDDLLASGGSFWTSTNDGSVATTGAKAFASPAQIAESRTNADAVIVDIDNDGDDDILLGHTAGFELFVNAKGTAWQRAESDGAAAKARGIESFDVVDLDGDGTRDIAFVRGDGRIGFLRGVRSEGAYDSVTMRLVGARDNRDGVGSTVEMFAGKTYQRVFVGGPGGVRIGLGATKREDIEGFSILWPNGIRQSVFPAELKWDKKGAVSITQKAGLVVSCPFLYTFDGERYRFLSDVVGIAPLDEWLPPGGTPHLDPEEYVRIPADRLARIGDKLRLVITEELRETTYLDRIQLVRLVHPRGTIVRNDESTRQGAVEPLRVFVYTAEDVISPRAVRDQKGADNSATTRERDRAYFHGYTEGPSQWAGWVEPWSLDIELPELSSENEAALLLTGRIAWQDSGVAYALHQHGRKWSPHALDFVSSGGEAKRFLETVGFPCGMDRTIVVPLGQVDPKVAKLRLSATSRLLWDRIAIATKTEQLELPDEGEVASRSGAVRTETLPLRKAKLDYHGYSKRSGNHERHEQDYDFHHPSPLRDFPSPAGRGTRYGDVRELVRSVDDRLVVIPPGDAVWFEFDAGAAPAADEEITYFLKLTGWAKEAGFHNTTGRTIGPMPVGSMKRYPPKAGETAATPDDQYRNYLQNFQTRTVDAW